MEKVLLMPEVSELLRTPVETLRYWRSIGAGPRSAKVGRRVVYREVDVRAWLDEQYRDGTDAA